MNSTKGYITKKPFETAATLPEFGQVLIQIVEQIGKKAEIHVHFVIQSTVGGNNLCGDNINVTSTINEVKTNNGIVGIDGNDNTIVCGNNNRIGHSTTGANSAISGKIAV